VILVVIIIFLIGVSIVLVKLLRSVGINPQLDVMKL